jgi:hypothetical protein
MFDPDGDHGDVESVIDALIKEKNLAWTDEHEQHIRVPFYKLLTFLVEVMNGVLQLSAYTVEELRSSAKSILVREKAPDFTDTFKALNLLASKLDDNMTYPSNSDSQSSSRPSTSESVSALMTASGYSEMNVESNTPPHMSMSADSALYNGLSGISNLSSTSKAEPEVQKLKAAFLVDSLDFLNKAFYLFSWTGVRVRLVYL